MLRGRAEAPNKRAKTEVPELTTPQPLTKQNLRLLQGIMTGPNMDSNADLSVATSKSSSTNRVDTQRAILRNNNLIINDRNAVKSGVGQDILEEAKKLVKSDEPSPMKIKQVEKFLIARDEEELSNEATFIYIIWHLLVGEARTKKKDDPSSIQETQSNLGDRLAPWVDDELRLKFNQQFISQCVPSLSAQGEKQI